MSIPGVVDISGFTDAAESEGCGWGGIIRVAFSPSVLGALIVSSGTMDLTLSGSITESLCSVPLLGIFSLGADEFPLGRTVGMTTMGGLTNGTCPMGIGPGDGGSWTSGCVPLLICPLGLGAGKELGRCGPSGGYTGVDGNIWIASTVVHSLANPLCERWRSGMDIMCSNPPHKPVF